MRVQLLANGLALGEAQAVTDGGYLLVTSLPPGDHVLSALALDATGTLIPAPPLNLHVE